MKLNYRGVSYDYRPNPMPEKGPVIDIGNYRGAAVMFNALAEQPPQFRPHLTWRGVPYRAGAPAPVVALGVEPGIAVTVAGEAEALEPEVFPTNNDVVALSRNLFMRRHQRMRRREQGMMVRLASEVGLSVAEAGRYESHIQGKMPHDFSGYGRSSTAMS